MERHPLLPEIEAYAAATGMTIGTVCAKAVNNPHLHRRLTEGGDCTLGVAEKLRRFFAENPPKADTVA